MTQPEAQTTDEDGWTLITADESSSAEPWVLPGAGPSGRDAYVRDRPVAAPRCASEAGSQKSGTSDRCLGAAVKPRPKAKKAKGRRKQLKPFGGRDPFMARELYP
mmetsp:Transcript_9229/g.28826  ORF Transcript_9229/g.28826 Transcript_9229/m.28826 type:complete len:105 (-) Transcript_9229:136-450(-)